MRVDCWSCGGDGHHGSACWDDCCNGGDVPCYHGDEAVQKCSECNGRGWLRVSDDDEDDLAGTAMNLAQGRQVEMAGAAL